MSFPWAALSTEISLCLLGLGLLVLDILLTDPRRKHWIGYAAIVGLALCLLPAGGICATADTPIALFGGLYVSDTFHLFFRVIAVLSGLLIALLSMDYLEHLRVDRGIYFTLIVFGVLAMVLLAGANDLIMVYLSVEYLSISSYVLVGFLLGRDRPHQDEVKRSSEASLKYLIFGAVASGAMLFGFSLLYALTGSTALAALPAAFVDPANLPLKAVAVALVLFGIGFKMAAAPFHQWAPDVYEGAPTPIAAFLAVGSKAATLAVVARLFMGGFADFEAGRFMLALMAVLTMFTGNLLAILQSNVKRMLGYSSVAHAGYLLTAIIANRSDNFGLQAMLLYLALYLFMNTGAFAFVIWFAKVGKSERIDDYAGLARRAPGLAVSMTIFMLALTGIPPTAGFIGKFYLIWAAVIHPFYWWLAVAIVINSVISAFYYLNVVRVMWYLDPPPRQPSAGDAEPPFASTATVYVCAVATIVLGLWFSSLLQILQGPTGGLGS